jgi:hypothetical protein
MLEWKGELKEGILIVGILLLAGIASYFGKWDIVSLVIGGALALLKGEKKV